jgi:MoaA/NifB/PqqE/SkfB family radical SAM enzyme
MSTKEVKAAMSEFANAGTIFWTFTGGEPLLRSDIGELVNYSKSLFPIVTLTTNGLLLKERLNEVKNVNYFTISLDGPREVTDRFRGRGTYDKTIEGIKAAREIGKDVIINAVISKANTENDFYGIKKLIELAKDLGCRINFSMIYEDQFNGSTIKECLIEKNFYINALDFIKKYKKNKFNFIMFSNSCINQLKHPKQWKTCYAGRLFCDLFPDGTVLPCLFKENQGINGLKYGFARAFKNLPKNENCICSSTCYNELNCIFSLKFKSVFENFLKYITFISQ